MILVIKAMVNTVSWKTSTVVSCECMCFSWVPLSTWWSPCSYGCRNGSSHHWKGIINCFPLGADLRISITIQSSRRTSMLLLGASAWNEFYLCKMSWVIKTRPDSRKPWGFEILFSLLEPWDRQSHYHLVVFVTGLWETTAFVVPLSSGSETAQAVVFFGSG